MRIVHAIPLFILLLSACKQGQVDLIAVQGSLTSSSGSSGGSAPVIYDSCKDAYDSDPGLPDGTYSIDHDGDSGTDPVDVTCDMTNGGWTQLIGDDTTSLADLANFGDTSDITGTFYTDSTYGIGWGDVANTTSTPLVAEMECLVMDDIPTYDDIKMQVSADHLMGALPLDIDSFGYLFVSGSLVSSNDIVDFRDEWFLDTLGANSLDVLNVELLDGSILADTVNEQVTTTYSGTVLRICMAGKEDILLPTTYNKRYIQELWIK